MLSNRFNPAPQFLDADELNTGLFEQIRALYQPLLQISDSLRNSLLLSGSEAYSASLKFYNSIKQANKSKVQKAETIYTDLVTRCSSLVARGETLERKKAPFEGEKGSVNKSRSYARQGKDQIPTIHLGVAAHQMERRGIRTERGDINREIEVTNANLRQLKARIVKLQNWLKEETANTEPPTLADYVQDILSRKAREGKSQHSQSLYNLQDAADMLNFLTRNKTMDMAGLDDCFGGMIGRQQDIREKLKPIDRRLKILDEHIRHSGNYKSYRDHKAQYEKLYAQYQTIKRAGGFVAERKAQKALDTANEYHETHRTEIAMYGNAEKYLRDVLQERFDPKKLPPITKWKAERDKLTAERSNLNQRYYALKDEVKEAEQIRKDVTVSCDRNNRSGNPNERRT